MSNESGGALPDGVPEPAVLIAQIERDVRERRRSGVISEAFEADLERAFSEVAPPGATAGGFDAVADQAARHAIVDYDAPITGSRPLRFVKRAVKTLTAWYMIFVGRQLVAFAGTCLRALRILAGRVEVLEQQVPSTDPRIAASVPPTAADASIECWHSACVEVVAACAASGRVLHAECGDGALVAAFAAAGIDTYGIDPRRDAGTVADQVLVEVRRSGALEHLRGVAPNSLRAVVLSGCTERLALGDQLDLVESVHHAVAPNGCIVVIGQDPRSWARGASPIANDLSIGRPLHCETWQHLFATVGRTAATVHWAPVVVPAAIAERGDHALDALAAEIFAPASFMLVVRGE